jgi:hypothetical protein
MNILTAIKREERKLEKQLSKLQHPIEWSTKGRKSFGRFDEPRTKGRKEARVVRCRESEDSEGSEKEMG